MVSLLLRIEQLVFFLLILFIYALLGQSWWYFLLWILPDLGMIGYLKNKKVGASFYNLTHTYLFGSALFSIGYFLSIPQILAIGLVFCSHSALDRFLGYGLKYSSNFKDTHLQKV